MIVTVKKARLDVMKLIGSLIAVVQANVDQGISLVMDTVDTAGAYACVRIL
jgi:hypothetical protein